jgi:hypothetical protein
LRTVSKDALRRAPAEAEHQAVEALSISSAFPAMSDDAHRITVARIAEVYCGCVKLVAAIVFAGAALAWVVAVACWMISLRHLSGRRSTAEMLFRGMEAFNSENFTDEGKRWRKRFLVGMAVFALFVVAVAGFAIVSSRRGTS